MNKIMSSLWAIVILGPVAIIAYPWGAQILHFFTTTLRTGSSFWLPVIIGAILAWVLYFVSFEGKLAIVGVSLGLLVGGIMVSVVAPYQEAKGYYTASTETVKDGETPSYEERAPLEVAWRTSNQALMNITGDSVVTKSLADENTSGEWNTLVVERGWFKGYEVVQNMNLPLYGAAQNNNIKFCEFSDDAKLRDGGKVPSNNLQRAIYHRVPLSVTYNADDMYSYCNDDGEPVVVAPLKQIKGFLFTRWHPFGVAVYNGASGELEILKDVDRIDEIPGPVYPLSIARDQRESLIANGTWWEMYGERVSGYVAASDNTEVNLRRDGEKETDYVTILMPRGSSTSIVASSFVPSTRLVPGEYNKLTVAAFASENVRPANSTLVDDLKTRYSYMPDMANDTVGVFEITAGKDGEWVVSLGRDQSVNYRAYISANGDDVELYDRNGNLIAQGSRSADETGETTGIEFTPGTNVSGLSSEELNQLGKAVVDELTKRGK